MWLPLAPPSHCTDRPTPPPLLHRRPLSGAHRIFHPDQIIPTNKTRHVHVRVRTATVCVPFGSPRERKGGGKVQEERSARMEEKSKKKKKRARGRSIAAKKVREGGGVKRKEEKKIKQSERAEKRTRK